MMKQGFAPCPDCGGSGNVVIEMAVLGDQLTSCARCYGTGQQLEVLMSEERFNEIFGVKQHALRKQTEAVREGGQEGGLSGTGEKTGTAQQSAGDVREETRKPT